MEVFSPPRLVPAARAKLLSANLSIDLLTGWDMIVKGTLVKGPIIPWIRNLRKNVSHVRWKIRMGPNINSKLYWMLEQI